MVFGSQHPCDGSQASATPDLGVQCFPLTFWAPGTHVVHIYTCRQINHINKISKDKKVFKV